MKWNVSPVWFSVGPVSVLYYTVFFALGVVLAAVSCRAWLVQRGLPTSDFTRLAGWTTAALIVAAHLAHLVFYEPEAFRNEPVRVFELGEGLASHGGVVGAFAAIWAHARARKQSPLLYLDAAAVSALWLAVTIRIGNFFNSELVGKPTRLPWGVVFARAGMAEPRHPSQLYESLVGAALLLSMSALYRRHATAWKPGTALFLTLLLYFSTRFVVEYVKDFEPVTASPPLTMGQWLSIPFVVVSVLWLVRSRISAARQT